MNYRKRYSLVSLSITASAIAAIGISGCSIPTDTSALNDESVVCVKPNGKHYGLPVQSKCLAPDKEAKIAPDTGFLGLQNHGRYINYNTARKQGWQKTQAKAKAERDAFYKTPEGKIKKLEQDLKVAKTESTRLYDEWKKAEKQRSDYDVMSTKDWDYFHELEKAENNALSAWSASEDRARALEGKLEEEKKKTTPQTQSGQVSNDLKAEADEAGVSVARLPIIRAIDQLRQDLSAKVLSRRNLDPEMAASYMKQKMKPDTINALMRAGAGRAEAERGWKFISTKIDSNLGTGAYAQ